MSDMSELVARLRYPCNATSDHLEAADALEAQAREIGLLDAAYNKEIRLRVELESSLAAAEQEQANRRIVAMGEMNDALAARLAEADANAPWLTQAHMICTDHGIPQGNISDRLEMLVGYLAEAVALLREAAPHVGRGPVTKELRRRIDAFLAADSATHRETPVT